MRKVSIPRSLVSAGAVVTALLLFCKFPYEPEPFVLPELPYQFPDKGTLQGFLGTTNAKVVFTLTGNGPRSVYYVDFNDSAPTPEKLRLPPGNIGADSPLLSPADGTFVTYALLQGNNIHGAYIQKLDPAAEPVLVAANGTEPHWYTDGTDTYIIYSDLYLIQNLTGSGHTYKQKVSLAGNGSMTGAATVIAPCPLNGGLSKNGRYLCTGYQVAAFYDLSTSQVMAINSGNQTCNPSIDPDSVHPDRMMFLNFGGVQNLNNPLSGDPAYPPDGNLPEHGFLFIVNPSNTVQNFIPISLMGSGYRAWQCPEWSNKVAFAAALAAANDNSTAWDLVLIKNVDTRGAEEKLILTIGTGKMNSNSTPSLWIGN